ncbi:MAG: S53 family peptidase [Thermoprotei archaeon]
MPQIAPHVVYVGPQLSGQDLGPLRPTTTITVVALMPIKDYQRLYLEAQMIGNGQLNMTKAQLFEKYGDPKKAEEVASYFRSQGFTVQYVNPVMVVAYAPAHVVERTFQVSLHVYNFSGLIYYAPTSKPSFIPQLNGVTVLGLTNFTKIRPMYHHTVLGYFSGDRFVPALNGTNFHLTYLPLTLPQIAQAYNVTPGGKGVNVAIIVMYGNPTIYQDVQAFDKEYNLPPTNLTIVPLGPYQPELGITSGWAVETALDVEAVHAVAPYAHIYLVVASNVEALLASIPYVVSALNVSVVSMSWGLPNNLIAANGMFIYFMGNAFPNVPYLDLWFAIGNALGITFFASSGDGGAFSYTMTHYGGTSWPSSSPFVVSVGGTSLYPALVNGSYGYPNSVVKYSYETAWSVQSFNFPILGGGGGISANEPKLPFQPANYTSRVTPDVSADGNPYTGGIITVYGIKVLIGGTSMSAPIWAGIAADIVSTLKKNLGWFLPVLYEIYSNKELYKRAFHEITFGFNGAFYASKGYNLVTGLGTPDYYNLLKAVNETLNRQSLKVSVTTFANGYSLPWYNVNTTFQVVAYITYPNGSIVRSGEFAAYIYTDKGFISKVDLRFNGTYWVGEYTILPITPGGEWLIYVNGSSGAHAGSGASLIDVGPAIAILTPVPFPFFYYLPPNFPLSSLVLAYDVDGNPINASSLKGSLVYNGKVVLNLTFVKASARDVGLPVSPEGLYVARFSIITGMPQGVYLLFVNGSGYSVFTYATFGLNLLAVALPQVIGPEVMVSRGINLTIFTLSVATDTLQGYFTTNVTAYIYSPDGKLVKSTRLTPAPATTQFGVIYAFGLQEANVTLNLGQSGWYEVVIVGTYDSTSGTQIGNYTLWFYYTPSTPRVEVKPLGTVSTGQTVLIEVSLTLPNGTLIKEGNVAVNLVPANLYSRAIDYEVSNLVPLSFNETTRTWQGVVTFPSQLNESLTGLSGNSYSLSGQWYVEVLGVTPYGVVNQYVPVTVSPHTFLYTTVISPKNLATFTTNGLLRGVSAPNLTIIDVKGLTIEDSNFGVLVVSNSSVTILNSKMNTLVVERGDATVVNSVFQNSPVGVVAKNSKVILVNDQFVNVTTKVYSTSGQVVAYPEDQISSISARTDLGLVIGAVALVLAAIALISAGKRR